MSSQFASKAVESGLISDATGQAGAEPSQGAPSGQSEDVTTIAVDLTRKVIYTMTLGLVVTDYRQLESALPALVARHGGFVASNQTNRQYQDRQHGTWIVRIPVAQYAAFVRGVESIGFPESRSENAQDVTEEFVDLEARLVNQRRLEDRIVELLESKVGKLQDVLEIERELARIRELIERMEGRKRYLDDRTSLTTVTINVREQREYQPLQAPTLSDRMAASWGGSLTNLKRAGEGFLVMALAMLPWFLLLVIPAIGVMRFIRNRLRTVSLTPQ